MIEHQPPRPHHPQDNFGSGFQSASLAYPYLAKYYGDNFQAQFTVMDLLDSHEQRLQIVEQQIEELQGAFGTLHDLHTTLSNVVVDTMPNAPLVRMPQMQAEVAGMMANDLQQMITALQGEAPKRLPWRVRFFLWITGRSRKRKFTEYPHE